MYLEHELQFCSQITSMVGDCEISWEHDGM